MSREDLPVYSRGSTQTEFSMTLLDSDNPYNETPLDLSNNSKVELVFVKPDGVTVRKTGSLRDASSPTDTDIIYTDTDGTLVDQPGYWEYYASVTYANGRVVESGTRLAFWVV